MNQADINRRQDLFARKILNEKPPPLKIIQTGGGYGGAKKGYRAVCKENAGEDNIIHVNLYDSSGIEITTGTEGIDYNIPICCKTSPPENALNACSRRLATNDEIQVYQETFDDEGTPTKRWTAVEGFMSSLDYESL